MAFYFVFLLWDNQLKISLIDSNISSSFSTSTYSRLGNWKILGLGFYGRIYSLLQALHWLAARVVCLLKKCGQRGHFVGECCLVWENEVTTKKVGDHKICKQTTTKSNHDKIEQFISF